MTSVMTWHRRRRPPPTSAIHKLAIPWPIHNPLQASWTPRILQRAPAHRQPPQQLSGHRRPQHRELPSVAMGARVYDPYTGTFTQPDPIPGADANSYGYADGDPVNETDLTGREIDPDLGGSGDGDYADPETGGGGVSAADETTDRTDATLRDLRGGLNPPNLEVDTRADLEAVFEKLSEGGTPFQSGYAGSQVQLDDGTIVGLRDVSRSGDSTVDVDGRPGGAAKGRPNVNIHITRR
jgi:RHS repeat-associated protein